MAKTAKAPGDISGGPMKQAMSTAKSSDSGNTEASALSQSKPYPRWAGGTGGSPMKEYDSSEGYTHKVGSTGRLEPFSSDQSSAPEGYHKVKPETVELGPGEGTRTVSHSEDAKSGPPITKPGIPGA